MTPASRLCRGRDGIWFTVERRLVNVHTTLMCFLDVEERICYFRNCLICFDNFLVFWRAQCVDDDGSDTFLELTIFLGV